MLKINEINIQDDFRILCIFNNGISKIIHVLPLLQNHKHLPGIEKLKEVNTFAKARIGLFGEIIWDNIIEFKNGNAQTQLNIAGDKNYNYKYIVMPLRI